MKNDLLEITERSQMIAMRLSEIRGVPGFDLEMDALHILSHELLTSMGYIENVEDDNIQIKELQRALINFFFLGKMSGGEQQKNKVSSDPLNID